MEIVFLGTGNAFASGGRHAMAILLRAEGFGVLLDCGPDTLVALKRASLSPSDVDLVLLSHHHGDHFAGVPFLLCHERYHGRRARPFRVYGPTGTVPLLEKTVSLFFPGIEPGPFAIEYRDLEPGEEQREGERLSFRPFRVDHFPRGVALGYRVEMGGKSVVYSGDTAWTDVLARESEGADLFVCECSSVARTEDKHTSHDDLIRNRERIRARRTLLVHAGDDVLAREDELVYELARDGMRVTL
jgi:ribonuclease BN (tRNA processing enzyme)